MSRQSDYESQVQAAVQRALDARERQGLSRHVTDDRTLDAIATLVRASSRQANDAEGRENLPASLKQDDKGAKHGPSS